jgi:capsular exopolysaccharide synthesis family protein
MKFLSALKKMDAEQPTLPDEDLRFDLDQDREVSSLEDSIIKQDLTIGVPVPPSKERSVAAFDSRGSGNEPRNITGAALDHLKSAALDEGSIPDFIVESDQVNPHLVSITHPNSAFVEEYRSLRTQILQANQKRRLKSIVVASVSPAEGKSVTSLNLAWLLAQTDGAQTLLIDGDLRMPSLAKYLGFDAREGFSDVLAGEVSLRKSLIRLQPAGLYLVPAGGERPDVAELLSGPRFTEILFEAGGIFDFTIIDVPPIGVFTDASVAINAADGTLLVVRAGQTGFKNVERALENLSREKMLGVVLNQSEELRMGNSYYDYPYSKNY